MQEIHKSRWKLWHLVALVAGSAGLFAAARTPGLNLLVFACILPMTVFSVSLGFAVILGADATRAIDDWARRRGEPFCSIAPGLSLLAHVMILVCSPILALATLIISLKILGALDD